MALTELGIKHLRPRAARFEVPDGAGLYLRVAPSGLKTWIYRFRFGGRPRRLSLGRFPSLGLAAAREKAALAAQDLQRGSDPGRLALEAKAALTAAPTFAALLTEFWEVELSKKKSGGQTKALLEKNVLPAWGRLRVAEIKRRHIVLLLDGIAARAPVVRNRTHGALTRLFNFAAERGIIDDSPCTRIRKLPEKGRARVLTDAEIKLLWEALDPSSPKIDIFQLNKLALRLILLTGQRPGEVADMRWEEIEGETWTIPGERRKTGEANRVPMLPLALETLETARAFGDGSGLVFGSGRNPGRPVTRHALTRAVDRHWREMGIEQKWTPHDLRRTLRTRLAEIGVDDAVAERVLGHRLQGVLGIYNRYDYDAEKRQALARWERRLLEIVGRGPAAMGNVVEFRARGLII